MKCCGLNELLFWWSVSLLLHEGPRRIGMNWVVFILPSLINKLQKKKPNWSTERATWKKEVKAQISKSLDQRLTVTYSDLVSVVLNPQHDPSRDQLSSSLCVNHREVALHECTSHWNAGCRLYWVINPICCLEWMFSWYKQGALDDNILHKSNKHHACVHVASCDICSEPSVLSAQWSCEFNLSGSINLSLQLAAVIVRYLSSLRQI